MKAVGYQVRTSLTIEQAARLFQQTTQGMYNGSAKFGAGFRRLTGQGGGHGLRFFTPDDSDNPFARLDAATFSAGVSIPKFAGSGGGDVVIQMFAWEREGGRELKLITPYTIGSASASKKALQEVTAAFRAADREAQVNDL